MIRLHEIPKAFEDLLEEIALQTGEIDDSFDGRINDLLAQGEARLEDIATAILNCNAEQDALKKEITRLEGRSESSARLAERLKELSLSAVEAMGGKVKTPIYTIWAQSAPPSYDVEVNQNIDLKTLPEPYIKVRVEISKQNIINAYKTGEPLPEAINVVPREKRNVLRIK